MFLSAISNYSAKQNKKCCRGNLTLGITEGDSHLKVVALREVQALQVGLRSLRVHNGDNATQIVKS